ncbi:AraC family transcriptional regulator [Paenibacillus soyae]|uniref:AraC family transcriptional regulator n=1 Tax=Paenibacillus soyae TaxID=2969249 RepID=A0A9X2MVR1_9BACL|nr:AraC family transcriptional regulator [Paenibacillus soyae]MCR2807360.1 AraC family transcriptional regulator [Paenibacillus soyae]
MSGYTFNVERPLQLNMTGKFVAPSPEWMHMSRILMDYELFVPTKGILYIADEREQHALREGEFLLMPPRTKQYGYRASDCSFYWLHVTAVGQTDAAVDAVDEDAPGVIRIPGKGNLSGADKLIVMMKQLQDSIRSFQDPTLNNYLATSILCELHNQVKLGQSGSGQRLKQLQLYNDVVDYIKWNRFERLQVSEIAHRFGYNAKYLSHMFAGIAGMSLKQFVMQQKIEAASFLLTDTNLTVNEIALQLGFHDSHHFMRTFKQMTSLTPTGYRNSAANRLLFYE